MNFVKNLTIRLCTGCKLSGLLLGGCVVGGLCYYYKTVSDVIRAKIMHNGTVILKNLDTETALVIDDGHRRYCVDQQYFGVDVIKDNVVTDDVTITKTLALSKIAIGAKITIIGDTELDQYGTYWLVPSSHMYSGIYSDRHPITWIAKLL
jgi:hypothetical protein